MEVTSYLLGKKQGGGGSEPTGTINITSNGSHNVKSYATANVNVPTGITPTGTINITENGTSDVTNYASASVNVQPDLETKSITITENTITTITPTQGKDGLSSVQVTTNVSGGGGSIETINDVNDVITNYETKLKNMPLTYETLTQQAKTLYYPENNYISYFIYKVSNNKYRIAWGFNSTNGTWGLIRKKSSINYYIAPCDYRVQSGKTLSYYVSTSRYYSTNTYDTIEDCITAIQSNQTPYTKSTSDSFYQLNDINLLVLSNAYYVDDTTKELITPQRISSNETIQVKS